MTSITVLIIIGMCVVITRQFQVRELRTGPLVAIPLLLIGLGLQTFSVNPPTTATGLLFVRGKRRCEHRLRRALRATTRAHLAHHQRGTLATGHHPNLPRFGPPHSPPASSPPKSRQQSATTAPRRL